MSESHEFTSVTAQWTVSFVSRLYPSGTGEVPQPGSGECDIDVSKKIETLSKDSREAVDGIGAGP